MLDQLLLGFSTALDPQNLLFIFLGVLIGQVVGALPGLGPSAGMVLLLPLTFGLQPVTAVMMLAGIMYGAQYGGTLTSVLIKVPGEASGVMTAVDGNAMAQQGRAGAALSISAIGSFIAGIGAVAAVAVLAPLLAAVGVAVLQPAISAVRRRRGPAASVNPPLEQG
jgi:putative tricarboxylic transport membrane protein